MSTLVIGTLTNGVLSGELALSSLQEALQPGGVEPHDSTSDPEGQGEFRKLIAGRIEANPNASKKALRPRGHLNQFVTGAREFFSNLFRRIGIFKDPPNHFYMPAFAKVVILGREPDPTGETSLVIRDSTVSRRHAKITRTPEGDYTIEDLGSGNGTRVVTFFGKGEERRFDARKIVKSAGPSPICDGEQIWLGPNYYFIFHSPPNQGLRKPELKQAVKVDFDPLETLEEELEYGEVLMLWKTEKQNFRRRISQLLDDIAHEVREGRMDLSAIARARELLDKHRFCLNGNIERTSPREIATPFEKVRYHLEKFLKIRDINQFLSKTDETAKELDQDADGNNKKEKERIPGRTEYLVYKAYQDKEPGVTSILDASDEEWQKKVWGEINKDSLRFPSLQGWFWGGESPGKGTVVGRFYLSLQHTKAAAFWKVLSEVADGLKKQGITIRYKMGAYLTSMQRGDSAVVYFNVKDQKAVHQNVAELAQKNPTFFKGNIPVFAAQVLDSEGKPVRGLSFGQNPEEEFSSFGSKRSEAITAANREIREFLARGESISVEDAYKVMAYYLDKYEVDVQYPACEKGGIDQFKFVIEHTDQGK